MKSVRWQALALLVAVAVSAPAGCGGRSGPASRPVALADFVRVEGTRFVRGGRPFHHLGANFWGAMNLASRGPGGDRARLGRELDRLRDLGISSVRILGASEGPDSEPYRVVPALQRSPGQYDAALEDGLDHLMAALRARGMVAVVCLNNMWPWSGGMAQYLRWRGAPRPPYPMEPPHDWVAFQDYVVRFYSSPPALGDFRRHVEHLIGRVNRRTGVAYRNEPAIMAWELANEARGGKDPAGLGRFIHETARFIKTLDPYHLVTTGSEGASSDPVAHGLDFERDHRSPFVDYATFHFWAENWGFYDPRSPAGTYANAEARALRYIADHVAVATRLGKPLVLEEFGLARDGGSHDPAAPVTWRDRFFRAVLGEVAARAGRGEPLAGASFWSWAGEGRPARPGSRWRPGEPLTGDPPHEPAGWYSVYDGDRTTLEVLRAQARALQALNR